ncbi:uncharacterized protein N7525_001096 [Penicillium rubens]|uniref:Uncharacterized protein n=1 Tax=Penicillium chrysogenum TaxID=5076 RepID=A0ABQ8W536_PENCH|nr:uncharacterized protein N7525_001096 [Penicillium rubens]KAJ5255790.1 hypothetical protein N7505_010941 [Penicillium chrysogenum]KAJ5843355.1 hypothetical protein N7525_001096 [Penicillium rubens]KAJ5846060.1 hypothetical protein N7534_009729 [Penicillium rubens]KAJ6152406.1 hypothetical protein N7497_006725 [Penicillium chrysogenum]
MSGHWDVEQCNNKQLSSSWRVTNRMSRVDGWSPQRRGGMVEEMTRGSFCTPAALFQSTDSL